MKIKKLRVKAFRGFVDEKEFEFAPVTILFGPNGSGKSSTLNAIEWCLFGAKCIGRETGIRERIDWEIKNRSAEENPIVEIELENGDRIVRRWISERKDEFEGADKLNLLKKFSFKDFLVGVYQHQEVIRAILIEEPKIRNEGFDRLLGLSEYRNLSGILNIAIKNEVEEKLKRLENNLDNFKNEIMKRINTLKDDINKYQEDLKKEGVSDQEITKRGEKMYKENIYKKLKEFIKENMFITPSKEFETLSFESPTTEFVKIVKNEINECRSKMPDLKMQEDLFKNQVKLNRLLQEYEDAKKNLESKEKELRKFIEDNGKKEDLDIKKNEIDDGIKQLESEKEQKNLQASAIEKAIEYLRKEGVNKNICPVCGKETENLLDHLEREWKEKYEPDLKELNNQLTQLRNEKEKIEELIEKIDQLEQDKCKAMERLKEHVEKIGMELQREIKEDEDPKVIIRKELEKIEMKLKDIEKKIRDKQNILSDIEKEISNLEKIRDIVEMKQRCDNVREIEKTEKWHKINEKKNDLSRLKEKIKSIINAINNVSKEEVKSITGKFGDKINQYFKEITDHPAIKELNIEVKEDLRLGGNSYEIKDSDKKSVIPILSQGNLNALALSIFLALCENLPFEFIMLDDPSQSLSSKEKERFVEVLDKVSKKKNIIISTMDEELYNYLLSKMTKSKKIYRFERWNPNKGPEIKVES